MKTTFFIIFSFCGNYLFSQIKLELKLDFDDKIADITIVNNSSENYAFPLDKSFLRPYEPECFNYQEYEEDFPFLALMLMIEKQNNNELLTYYVEDYVDPVKFDSITREYQKEKKKHDNLIENWRIINKIKKMKDAKINYSIMNSFVYLKPNEKINYKVRININNITNQKFKFYSYSYDSFQTYKYYLEYCDLSKAYEYLTKKQKKEIKEKGYTLFSNKITSNFYIDKK